MQHKENCAVETVVVTQRIAKGKSAVAVHAWCHANCQMEDTDAAAGECYNSVHEHEHCHSLPSG